MISCGTARRLGLGNILRVLVYRALKHLGFYRWLLPTQDAAPLPLDLSSVPAGSVIADADRSVLVEADGLLSGRAEYFAFHIHEVGNPPDWFVNPFRHTRHPQPAMHWSRIPDFSTEIGDIKIIWELSRFMWAPVFARAWRLSGDKRYLVALQHWIEHWWQSNPPNVGPNWKCGQETSIRLINTLLAFHLLGVDKKKAQGLIPFVEAHCRRIAATTFYAASQDNNHGTSEAAGLFVGGLWLAKNADEDLARRGRRWATRGKKLLHRLVNRLVLADGSFAQHSLTYHRVMLDTLSLAEIFRRWNDEPLFKPEFYTSAASAVRWLGAILEPSSGDGPNLGSNDGALPYRLGGGAYRDFRPCLQLASVLFLGTRVLESGLWDEGLLWLGLLPGLRNELSPPSQDSAWFREGGYLILREGQARVLIRAPTARFRPLQADALHMDLWWKGENLLRDGGTYSYAEGPEVAQVLAGVAGHNTLQFDDRDQMPRLGRFLYGAWLRVVGSPAITTNGKLQSWAGGYTDAWGAKHQRTVDLGTDSVRIRDHIAGFKEKAVLRWRLAPGEWTLNDAGCVSSLGRLQIDSTVPIRRISLENGWESRHYMEKSVVPVLEVEISSVPAELTTLVTLS